MDTIIVLDFGSQLAHLICRRIRDLGVYSEIVPFDIPYSQLKEKSPVGIIFSGGPASVYEDHSPHPSVAIFTYTEEFHIPILGLCYGHHLLAQHLGGKVESHREKEFGKAILTVLRTSYIFEGLNSEETVWMSHGDQVAMLPEGFEILAETDTCPIAAMGDFTRNYYGLQFHPEVFHTVHGTEMLSNYLFQICHAKDKWSPEDWIETSIQEIRDTVGNKHVLLGLSGGVDSSVVAVLLHKAIGDNVHPVFVNNGLLRKNEADKVCEWFQHKFAFKNFKYVDASNQFLTKLEGISDPEQKRKIIGHSFIEVFEKAAEDLEKQYPEIKFLAQGTIYPDRVESQAGTGGKTSSKIKSHHNLALPDDMQLSVLEPIKDLYKDEVRRVGRILGIPAELIDRHPFPGPGLAVRCLGEIRSEYLDILRNADEIAVEEIKKADLYNQYWQVFAVFLPIKSVGVMGDFRTYEYVCALRMVESSDAMTANFAKPDWNVLERISTRIINEVKGINRVVYDISNKPPSTIEFE